MSFRDTSKGIARENITVSVDTWLVAPERKHSTISPLLDSSLKTIRRDDMILSGIFLHEEILTLVLSPVCPLIKTQQKVTV